jgi:hypothetical protein
MHVMARVGTDLKRQWFKSSPTPAACPNKDMKHFESEFILVSFRMFLCSISLPALLFFFQAAASLPRVGRQCGAYRHAQQ